MKRRSQSSDPRHPVTEPDDGSTEAEEDEAPETPPEPEPEPEAALPHIPQEIVNPPYEPPPLPETPTAGTEPEPMEKRDG